MLSMRRKYETCNFVCRFAGNVIPLALHTAEASSATINLALGVTLHLGDRDRRGYYWDGGRWREPRWWHDRYQYNDHRWWPHEEWKRHRAGSVNVSAAGTSANVANTGVTITDTIGMTATTIITLKSRRRRSRDFYSVICLPAERFAHQQIDIQRHHQHHNQTTGILHQA